MVGSSMVNRGGMVGSSMVDRGSMVRRGMVASRVDGDNSVGNGSRGIVGSSMIRSRSIAGNGSRCMHLSYGFLLVSVSVDSLGSGMGLGCNGSMGSSMSFVHGGGDRRSISKFDGLMMGLVSGDNGQESCTDKCLKIK